MGLGCLQGLPYQQAFHGTSALKLHTHRIIRGINSILFMYMERSCTRKGWPLEAPTSCSSVHALLSCGRWNQGVQPVMTAGTVHKRMPVQSRAYQRLEQPLTPLS